MIRSLFITFLFCCLALTATGTDPVDYSKSDNWLALPSSEEAKKEVDVFFLYPTSWRANGAYPIADINNAEMRKWANYYLKTRASAFDTGNIFAPYYRQMDAAFALSQKSGVESAMKFPKTDVVAAFDYYIKHYNNGRPFILAGHSQGSLMIRELLIDYMKQHPDVYDRMVAAYVIGIPMIKEDYAAHPHIKPAQSADDIGVVISYNTEAPVVDGINPLSVPSAVTINPISWRTTDERASAEDNLGSIIVKDDGSFKNAAHIADAKINPQRGTIICTTVNPEEFSSEGASRDYFPVGVFHENDIPLYYYNLKQNAQNRVKRFFERNIQ
jgi:hypothetical protein